MLIRAGRWLYLKWYGRLDHWGLVDPGDLPVGRQRRVVGVVAAGGLQACRRPRRHLPAALLQRVRVTLKHRTVQLTTHRK